MTRKEEDGTTKNTKSHERKTDRSLGDCLCLATQSGAPAEDIRSAGPVVFVSFRVFRGSIFNRLYFAWASAKAESNSRPADLKPIRSLTNRAASAAPYSRSMPQSSHSTESGPS
jgi:hypothetical protein